MRIHDQFQMRRNVLLAITGLVVAFVRTHLQYHQYGWGTVTEFLTSWFIHYVAVALLAAVAYAAIKANAKRFLAEKENEAALSVEAAIVYICITLLTLAVAIFVLSHAGDVSPAIESS